MDRFRRRKISATSQRPSLVPERGGHRGLYRELSDRRPPGVETRRGIPDRGTYYSPGVTGLPTLVSARQGSLPKNKGRTVHNRLCDVYRNRDDQRGFEPKTGTGPGSLRTTKGGRLLRREKHRRLPGRRSVETVPPRPSRSTFHERGESNSPPTTGPTGTGTPVAQRQVTTRPLTSGVGAVLNEGRKGVERRE